jgi:hypothetical protein
VGISTDEAQNLWVATRTALYLLKPADKQFRRFDVKDGLHLQGNPVAYCDSSFAGGDRTCPILGAAADPGISEIAGGGPNDEVFVGYFGIDDGNGDWSDLNRHSGKLDRVRLAADGSLRVDRMDFVSSNTPQFWHDRTVHRLLYDHFLHPHELYVGTNHGVDRLWPDKYRSPASGEWFLKADAEWMVDHLHPQVCYHHACDSTLSDLRLGDWRGLALSKDGNLWVGGRWNARNFRYYDPVADAGMADADVSDMLALPDGRLALGGRGGLVLWDPKTATHSTLRGPQYLPNDHVLRIELDQMVDPPALHIATWGGAASIRRLP